MNVPHLAPHRERRVRHLTGLLVGGAIVATLSFGVPALTAAGGDAAEGAGTTITTAAGTSTSSSTSTSAPETTTTTTTPPLSPEEQVLANIQALSPEEAAAFVRFTSPPPPPPPTTTTTAPKPKVTAPPAPKAAPQTSTGGAPGGFLACVRQRESRGNYSINTGNGYYGAYQFSQTTWNNTANHAGRGDLVGVPPSSASPADQDAMAQHLLSWQGTSPWAGPGC